MIKTIRRMKKREEGMSTIEFIALLPGYLIITWICLEALFFYNFIIFDGFADARDEILEECYKANNERMQVFSVKGGLPIINDLIDLFTIFFPDSSDLRFKIACVGN